jgi:hypothetical protein
MKYFAIALFALLSLAVSAQPCTPNPQYADSSWGFWPDNQYIISTSMSDPAGFNFVFDTKTPVEHCFDTLCVYVKAVKVDTIVGLPQGFVVSPNYTTPAYWENGGTAPALQSAQGCMILAATQQTIQSMPLGLNPFTISLDYLVKNQDTLSPYLNTYQWLSTLGFTIDYPYQLCVVMGTDQNCITAIGELPAKTFSVGESYPNPATCAVNIPFSVVKEEPVTISIYTIWGVLVSQTTMQSKPGNNVGIVDTSTLPAGWYMCQVSNRKEIIYKRVIVE